jgi:hypothetical protein
MCLEEEIEDEEEQDIALRLSLIYIAGTDELIVRAARSAGSSWSATTLSHTVPQCDDGIQVSLIVSHFGCERQRSLVMGCACCMSRTCYPCTTITRGALRSSQVQLVDMQ